METSYPKRLKTMAPVDFAELLRSCFTMIRSFYFIVPIKFHDSFCSTHTFAISPSHLYNRFLITHNHQY